MLLRRCRVSGCLRAAFAVPHRFFVLVHGGGTLPADSLPVFPTLPGGDNDLRDCPQVSRLTNELRHRELHSGAVIANERHRTAFACLIEVEGAVCPTLDALNGTYGINHVWPLPVYPGLITGRP